MERIRPGIFDEPGVRSPELVKAVNVFGKATKLAECAVIHKQYPYRLQSGRSNLSWPMAKRIAISTNEYAGEIQVSPLRLIEQLGD